MILKYLILGINPGLSWRLYPHAGSGTIHFTSADAFHYVDAEVECDLAPGLYLDRNVQGTKERHLAAYTLFELHEDCTVTLLSALPPRRVALGQAGFDVLDYEVRHWFGAHPLPDKKAFLEAMCKVANKFFVELPSHINEGSLTNLGLRHSLRECTDEQMEAVKDAFVVLISSNDELVAQIVADPMKGTPDV